MDTDSAAPYIVTGVRSGHERVEAWSIARLPFEPKGWLRQFRDDLAEAVRGLGPDSGRILHADYVSDVQGFCDVENVLFYNVGSGCFAASASDGLRFERGYGPFPPPPHVILVNHYYRYRLSPPRTDFVHWRRGRTLAQWDNCLFDSLGGLRTPAQVWGAMAGATVELREDLAAGHPFGLSITLHHPASRALNLSNLVKTVFDGTIAAFHLHNGLIADQVRAQLAKTLKISTREVDARLFDDRRAILGPRRLVWPFGASGMQWNPADDRCLAGELLSVPTQQGGTWRVSGALFEIESAISSSHAPSNS